MQDDSAGVRVVRFGGFELDTQSGELRRQGVRIKLQEQPFRILEMLLANPDRLVTREEVRRQLWPSNSFVDFDQGLNKAINKLREALGDSAEEPRFVETLSRRGYRFICSIEARPRRIESLAVLPLENLSRDPEQEYFADGVTEALITSLAKIGALRVVSRTSVMQYKGVRKSLPDIGAELQVQGVVEGTVQRSGERLRISAQLVHAPTDTHLWAESYDRDLRDVLSLQSEVAQAIAREVQVKLTPLDQARITQVHPVIPEAYDAYLQGRYHWNRRSGEELKRAAEYFEQAIAKDPDYAAAYAGLADCFVLLGFWGLVSPEEGCRKAKLLAMRALDLDHSLADAHASLAFATMLYDYDFVAAETEFERSIELNPRYATAHQWFGVYLAVMARFDESYTELKRAIRLDPDSMMFRVTLGWAHWCAHQYDRAIDEFEKVLAVEPNFLPALFELPLSLYETPLHERAIAAARKAVELSRGAPIFVHNLAAAYAIAGSPDDAQTILQQLRELAKDRYVTPYVVARIYASLGKRDEALRWLEIGLRDRAAWMINVKVDPRFDTLRSDPRFEDLLRRMNFPS